MVFFIDEARSRPPPPLFTNVNKKMVFFIEGFPYHDWVVQVRPGEIRHPRPGAGRQRGPALQHPLRPPRGHLHGNTPAQDRS